jgi:hypothetical protein
MPASNYQARVDSADFACARCWKQKKKCDKATPRCERCTMYEIPIPMTAGNLIISSKAAVCVYSTHPPKGSVFTVKSLDTFQTNHFVSGIQSLSVDCDSTLNPRSTKQFACDNWDEVFAAQVHGIFTASGKDIASFCTTYFENFQQWLPVISQHDFWRGFSTSGSHPEFSTLLLSIYLITHVPAQESSNIDTLEPVYFTAKSAWYRLQKIMEP